MRARCRCRRTSASSSADPERYQTVYARAPGLGRRADGRPALHAGAARSAVRERCTVVEVDLRIGLDTFRPVAVDDLDDHAMHSEAYAVDPRRARAAAAARAPPAGAWSRSARRRRACWRRSPTRPPRTRGRTRLKIQPGYAVPARRRPGDELPPAALDAARAGDGVRRRGARRGGCTARRSRERYRFYSFGDAMLLTASQTLAARVPAAYRRTVPGTSPTDRTIRAPSARKRSGVRPQRGRFRGQTPHMGGARKRAEGTRQQAPDGGPDGFQSLVIAGGGRPRSRRR